MGEKGYKEILAELEDGTLANPLFFYGDEEFLVKWAIERITEHYIGHNLASLNVSVVNWGDLEISDLIALWETLPMMAEKRLIVVEDFENDGKDEILLEKIKDLPQESILILTSEKADKRRKIYRFLERKKSCFYFGRLKERELRNFIVKRFKQAGKLVDRLTVQTMMDESGYFHRQSNYNLYNMENDIKKLIALSEGEIVEIEQLKDGLTRNTEAYIFDMIDAISYNNKGEAIYLLHRLFAMGEVWQRLLPLISSGYELMLIIAEMFEDGHSLRDIISFTGAHEYRVRKLSKLARKYSVRQLRKIVSKSFAVDREIKTGLLESNFAMELFIANI